MATTNTQIHIQAIFAVQNRQSLVQKDWKNDPYKYITGIVKNYGHKVLQINGMPDHIHILFGMRPTQSLSDLMKNIKQDSSKWVNNQGFLRNRFSWQAGYGAFSYAKPDVPYLIRYIKNQEEHHKKTTFTEEYLKLLNDFDTEYDNRYILKSMT